MYGMLLSDRRQSLGEITDQFNRQFVTKISSRTVRRRLNFEGYKKHPVCKKTTISPVNREKRKRFCRSKLMWTVRNHWKKVIFSDETKIEIGNNRKVYVWRKVDERLRPECNGLYQGRNYKAKFSVMFWGCISYYGVGTLTPVVGNGVHLSHSRQVAHVYYQLFDSKMADGDQLGGQCRSSNMIYYAGMHRQTFEKLT